MLDDIGVSLVRRIIKTQPRVCLEGHEAKLIFASDEEHDITVGLLALLEELLFDHLRVVHEADELPLAQIDDLLRHVQGHMNDCDLTVLRIVRLVGEEGIVYDPGLWNWLLRVMQLILLLRFFLVCITSLLDDILDNSSD